MAKNPTRSRASELAEKIADISNELENIEATLPSLRARLAELKDKRGPVLDRLPSEEYAASIRLQEAEARAADLRSELRQIEPLYRYYAPLETADGDQLAAAKNAKKARDQIDELTGKRAKLVRRIAEAELARNEALIEAESLERQANETYADACENGSDAEIASALAGLNAVQADTRAARERSDQAAGILSALQEKLTGVETRITESEAALKDANVAHARARMQKQKIAWDGVVDELVELGRELQTTAKEAGYCYAIFGRDMRISYFAPDRRSITSADF